jgi:hypothetical protein
VKKHGFNFMIILWWIVSIAIAILLWQLILFGVLWRFISGDNEDWLGLIIMLPLYALITGSLQWIYLHFIIKKAGWWIPSTIMGIMTGYLFLIGLMRIIPSETVQYLGETLPDPIAGLMLWGTLQGSMGLSQWMVLRYSFPKASAWIFISLLAGVIFGVIVGQGIQSPSSEVYALPLCLGGIPGFGLAVLLYQREKLMRRSLHLEAESSPVS